MDEKRLLSQVITATRKGQKAEARQSLKEILTINPRNETAWLWLSTLVESDVQRNECLQRVLGINPHNETARKKLEELKGKVTPVSSAPQPAVEHQDLGTSAQVRSAYKTRDRIIPRGSSKIYCPSCGAENSDTNRFCLKCGTALRPKSVRPSTSHPSRGHHLPATRSRVASAFTVSSLVGMVGGALAVLGWLMPWFRIATGLSSPFGSLFELDISIGSGLQLSLLMLAAVFGGLSDNSSELGAILIALLLLTVLVAIPILGVLNVLTGISLFENRSTDGQHVVSAAQNRLSKLRKRSTAGLIIMVMLFALVSLIPFLTSFLGGGFYLTAGAFAFSFLGALLAKSQVRA